MYSTESQSNETKPIQRSGSEVGRMPPKSVLYSSAPAAVLIAILGLVVWHLNQRQPKLTPAPLQPAPSGCRKVRRHFVPSNITELPQWQAAGGGQSNSRGTGTAVFSDASPDQK